MWTKIMTNPAELEHEALAMFQDWLDAACKTGLHEPTAMTLATANAQGRPSARTVLLKSFDERGFVFFTNSQSRKGVELRANAFVSLCFFWQPLMRQVRIEGRTVTVSAEESDAYWESRPRDTQLGAWASQQSRPLDFRETLEKRMAEVHARLAQIVIVSLKRHCGLFRVFLRTELLRMSGLQVTIGLTARGDSLPLRRVNNDFMFLPCLYY
jgi:pyridoxamine-phosphate oxidase